MEPSAARSNVIAAVGGISIGAVARHCEPAGTVQKLTARGHHTSAAIAYCMKSRPPTIATYRATASAPLRTIHCVVRSIHISPSKPQPPPERARPAIVLLRLFECPYDL